MRLTSCEDCAQHRACIVSDLPPGAIEQFRNAGASVAYKPRQVIIQEGSPIAGLHQVCSGQVKLYQSDPSGRDHILAIKGPGALLGELPRNHRQTYSISAETLTDTRVRFVPREPLERFLQRHPGTALRLIAALSDELAATRRKVRDLALKGAEGRLACLLRDLAEAAGCLDNARPFVLAYSRRDLAEMIGVSTETAIRLLGRLQRAGIIASRRRELLIHDGEKLRRVAAPDINARRQAA